jgi:DNA-binding transcriptional LysR family regulator
MSPNLSFRALEIFVAVAETRSMAAAANRLKSSVSNVSQQISGLEASLDTQLIDRTARPIALTIAGTRFLAHAHGIMDHVTSARSDMMEMQLSTLPSLRLAIVDGLDLLLAPDLMTELHRRHPTCDLAAWSGKTEQNQRSLQEREVDIVVSADSYEHHDALERHPLLREPLILVSAPGVLKDGEINHESLQNAPYVRFSDELPLGKIITTHLRRVRMDFPNFCAFHSSRSIFATILKVGGWTITTPICLLDTPGFIEQLEMHIPPFPTTGRTVSIWARRGELAGLPERLAEISREILLHSTIEPGIERMPWLEGRLKVIHDLDE